MDRVSRFQEVCKVKSLCVERYAGLSILKSGGEYPHDNFLASNRFNACADNLNAYRHYKRLGDIMERAELREKIADCLASNLDTDKGKLLSDVPFAELDYDSLTMAEVIFMLEDEFNVKFDDVKTSDYPTRLSELADQVLQLLPEAQQC